MKRLFRRWERKTVRARTLMLLVAEVKDHEEKGWKVRGNPRKGEYLGHSWLEQKMRRRAVR